MTPAELIAVIGVTFSIAVVVVLKLSKPTIINNYAPKAEAYADSGGTGAGPSGVVGALVKVGVLGLLLTVALAVISAITNIATSATDAISEAARPVVVQAPAPVEVPMPTPAPVQVPVPAPVEVPVSGLGDLFSNFLAAGGWIPFVLIVALILTRPRGKREGGQPTTVYYPPRQEGAPDARGIPIESVPLFSGSREDSKR